MPRSTTALAVLSVLLGSVQASTDPPSSTLAGTVDNCDSWAVVKSGDNCETLEKNAGISSEQFFEWNPEVSTDCATSFWSGYAYCVGTGTDGISPTTTSSSDTTHAVTTITSAPGPTLSGTADNCDSWVLVKSGVTCETIEEDYDITLKQFLSWNQAVNSDCSQDFWLNYAYCVGTSSVQPGQHSTTTTSSVVSTGPATITSVPTTTTSFNSTYSTRYPITSRTFSTPSWGTCCPPSHTLSGTPGYCNRWHLVAPGETCQNIISTNTVWMNEHDFYAWNPSVGTDCGGLVVYSYVCIGIQPQTSMTISWPTTNATLPSAVIPTSTPLPSVTTDFSPTPTQGPLPKDCVNFYLAQPNDNCNTVIDEYRGLLTKDQFFQWNPALNNNCEGMWANYYYCALVVRSGAAPPLPTVTTKPTTSVDASIDNSCKSYYQSTDGDDCEVVVDMFGSFSQADFIQWNPSVLPDCSGFEIDEWYCVGIPGSPTTRTAPIPTTTAASFPTQSGIASNCTSYWLVSSQDSCDSISSANGISTPQFLQWNPSVAGSDSSCANLIVGDEVCVQVNGVIGASSYIYGYNDTSTSVSIWTFTGTLSTTAGPTATGAEKRGLGSLFS